MFMCLRLRRVFRSRRVFFFLMIRRPPRSTLDRSSAASDVYKRQEHVLDLGDLREPGGAIGPGVDDRAHSAR